MEHLVLLMDQAKVSGLNHFKAEILYEAGVRPTDVGDIPYDRLEEIHRQMMIVCMVFPGR